MSIDIDIDKVYNDGFIGFVMFQNDRRIELICGENDYLKKQYINSLVSKFTSNDQESFSEVIYVDGKSASI